MNVCGLDRWFRIIVGIILVGFAAGGAIGLWGWIIGLILLVTGLIKWCPLYSLIGFQTCGLAEQKYGD
ncbi:DUF2892 domain-containing protein [Sulfurivirga sp.]|uniref:YgaP family membrane protein n=1 Tax=Sulfurivirga sp. TaxID=2614236 RepID=UPI0025DCEE04|nr:DUF2892 domain-containing protein [Sulfurivirga sp.]